MRAPTLIRPSRRHTDRAAAAHAQTHKRRDDWRGRLRNMLGADAARRDAVKVTLPTVSLPRLD